MARWVLAGDVGGTKVLLGIYRVGRGGLELELQDRFATAKFDKLEAVVESFLERAGHLAGVIRAAAFGTPAPIIEGVARPSNIPWVISESVLSRTLNGLPVRLLNDLGAAAFGVRHLRDKDTSVLNSGSSKGSIAIIAAGTGLGEAALTWSDGEYHLVGSEGGHASFAPRDAEQLELLAFLEREFGHVSYERVLSGPGLVNIYRFLRSQSRAREPRWLTSAFREGDQSATISKVALARRDKVCVHTLEMFCSIYGAEAGNLALKVLALGGVYLCGGIAPKILPMLRRGGFMKAFVDKGRMRKLLQSLAVRVCLNPDVGLLGAAHAAAAMLG